MLENKGFDLENYIEGLVHKSEETNEIQANIENIMKSTRDLYWSVLKAKQKGDITETFDNAYIGVIEVALKYTELSRNELENLGTESDHLSHIMSQPSCEGDSTMTKRVAGVSIVPLDELKHAWSNLVEYSNAKAFFTLIGTILSVLIGPLTSVTWAFIVLTIINFIMRMVANKFRKQDDYIRLQRNIGMFLWSYTLLAIGNTLGGFVSINGLPNGTFPAFILVVLVWTELRGIVENAKLANLNVPSILDRIVNIKGNKTEKDIDPPF